MRSHNLIVAIGLLFLIACKEEKQNHTFAKTETTSKLLQPGELTKEINVIGEVKKPLIITVDILKTMKVVTGGELQLVCRSGENKKKVHNFKGVLLKDILEKAEITIQNPKESGCYVVLITSTNDYKVSYAYNELRYNETGNNVYVTFEENGAPITEDGGLMSVLTLNDNVTGVRHVKWPKTIEVIKL